MAVVHETIDQRRRHHVITEDLAPLFEAFVGRQHRRRVFVTVVGLKTRFPFSSPPFNSICANLP
jgi:hypothetical protein